MRISKPACRETRIPLSTFGETNRKAKHVYTFFPFIVTFSAWYVFYYFLNANTPPFGDDVALKFVWQGWNLNKANALPVTSISQIADSMRMYYFTERGRVISLGLGQLFAAYGKQYFNLLNPLVFMGIITLTYFHSNYGKRSNWFFYLSISVVFWLLTPKLMPTTLWMISSLNECWPVFFVLLFLVPYRKIITDGHNLEHPFVMALFIIPIGFLAGAFNYQAFGLSISFSALALMFLLVKKRNVPLWSIIGLLSTIGGTLFILLAPGNSSFSNYSGSKSLLLGYIKSFPGNVISSISHSVSVTMVLFLFCIIVSTWLYKDIRSTAITVRHISKHSNYNELHTFLFSRNNELSIPTLFLINAFNFLILFTTYALMCNCFIHKVFCLFAIIIFVYTEALCLWQIITIVFASSHHRKSSKTKHMIKAFVENDKSLLVPCLFLLTTISSVLVHSALPYFDDRLFFTVFVSFTIFFFNILSEAIIHIRLKDSKIRELCSNRYIRTIVPAMICLIVLFDIGNEFRVYHRDYVIFTDFVTSIQEKIDKGEKDIILPPKSEIKQKLLNNGRLHSFIYYWSIGDYWPVGDGGIFDNQWFAFCLGADTVTEAESQLLKKQPAK